MMGEHLSVSQIKMYLRCPAQYYFRYCLDKKIAPSGAMVFGSALHKAAEINYTQKIDSGVDLPIDDMKDIWADSFNTLSREALDQRDWEENPADLKDEGVEAITLYQTDVAANIQPLLAETWWRVEFDDNKPLVGIIDVVDIDNRVIDIKTSKRAPSSGVIDNNLQLTAYSLGMRHGLHLQETELRLDYLVRNKTPKIVTMTAGPRPQAEIDRFLRQMSRVSTAIESEQFYPCDPESWACSPRWCGYWKDCQQTF